MKELEIKNILDSNIDYTLNIYFTTLLNIPLYSICCYCRGETFIIDSNNESIIKEIYNYIKELNLTIINHGDFCVITKIDNNFNSFLTILKLKGLLK